MTPEQKAAYINAQVALMNGEMQGMISENREREEYGGAQAYGPNQWAEWQKRWESVLGHNAVTVFFMAEI